MTTSNDIVIVTEKSSSILIDNPAIEKVSDICPNVATVRSGTEPDFRLVLLVAKVKKNAQTSWKVALSDSV